MNKIIEVENLSKSFGEVQAVNNCSFYVEKGSLFAFLGTNGAGKSTTISILLTLLQQDKGTVKVHGYMVGKDDHAIRKEIGVVFQESLLDALLTVEENLKIRSAFYGHNKKERDAAIERVVSLAGLHSFLKRPYGKLSGGEKRRADIARALLHNPSILVLDEPTTGLDSQSRKNIWETILILQKERKMTVFLTTHYIEEAVGADYVVVMKEGNIIAKGTPEQLKDTHSSHKLICTTNNEDEMKNRLLADQYAFHTEKSLVYIALEETLDAIPILSAYSKFITSFEVRKSSLDDVFIVINGKDVTDNVSLRQA
ncbi:ABC transporter ATP-binding protein [Sporosarcina sp. CAU 1771]